VASGAAGSAGEGGPEVVAAGRPWKVDVGVAAKRDEQTWIVDQADYLKTVHLVETR